MKSNFNSSSSNHSSSASDIGGGGGGENETDALSPGKVKANMVNSMLAQESAIDQDTGKSISNSTNSRNLMGAVESNNVKMSKTVLNSATLMSSLKAASVLESAGANANADDDRSKDGDDSSIHSVGASSVGMSSLTSADRGSSGKYNNNEYGGSNSGVGSRGSVTGIPMSITTLERMKKREEFVLKDNAANGGPPLLTGFESSTRNSESGFGSDSSVIGSGANSVSGSGSMAASMGLLSTTSTRSYKPQAEIDIGRDNPGSSAFEEQTGSLELPFEMSLPVSRTSLPLTAARKEAHDRRHNSVDSLSLLEEDERGGENNNDFDSATRNSIGGTDLSGKREIAYLKTVHGSRPTTRERKEAVELQQAQEEHARIKFRREEEERRRAERERENEQREKAETNAAQARLMQAKQLEEQHAQEALLQEQNRLQAEAQAQEQADRAMEKSREASAIAAKEKTAEARRLAVLAAQAAQVREEQASEVTSRMALERLAASRPSTQENRPPLSPPPGSRGGVRRISCRDGDSGGFGSSSGSRPDSAHNNGSSSSSISLLPVPAPDAASDNATTTSTSPPSMQRKSTTGKRVTLAVGCDNISPRVRASPITVESGEGIVQEPAVPVRPQPRRGVATPPASLPPPAVVAAAGKPRTPASTPAPAPAPALASTLVEKPFSYEDDTLGPDHTFGVLQCPSSTKASSLDAQMARIDSLEEAQDVDVVSLSDAYYHVGVMRRDCGQHLDALAALERSYRLQEWQEPRVILIRLKQLVLLAAAVDGMQTKCLKLCREVEEECRTYYGGQSVDMARILYFTAEVQAGQGQGFDGESVKGLRKACAIFTKLQGADHAETKNCLFVLSVLTSEGTGAGVGAGASAVDGNEDEDDEEVCAYDESLDNTAVTSTAAADGGALETFTLRGEEWTKYHTTADDGNVHEYFLAYLAGAQHSQWEDPRISGIVDLAGYPTSEEVQAAAKEEEQGQEDGYDMGIHSIGLPGAGSSAGGTDSGYDSGLSRVWELKRMQQEVDSSLGGVAGANASTAVEDDDDVLNASTTIIHEPAAAAAEAFGAPQGGTGYSREEQVKAFSMQHATKF